MNAAGSITVRYPEDYDTAYKKFDVPKFFTAPIVILMNLTTYTPKPGFDCGSFNQPAKQEIVEKLIALGFYNNCQFKRGNGGLGTRRTAIWWTKMQTTWPMPLPLKNKIIIIIKDNIIKLYTYALCSPKGGQGPCVLL